MNSENHLVPDVALFSEPFFFFSTNAQLELLYVSPSVEPILGYPPVEILGRQFSEFLDTTSPLNQDQPDGKKTKHFGGENRRQLRVVETRDARLKVLKVQTYSRQNEDNRPATDYSIAEDITDMYFAEQEMHNRLLELQNVDRQLNDRDRFVLERVIDGMPNKVIAKRLKISERSVEMTRSRLVKKFGCGSMMEVVAKSIELRLLTDVILLAHGAHPRLEGPKKSRKRVKQKLATAKKSTGRRESPN